MQAELLQGDRREARAVALVADQDDAPVRVVGDREAVRAGRVEAPLEHVAVDDERARQLAVAEAQLHRPHVDDECPTRGDGGQVRGLDPVERPCTFLDSRRASRAPPRATG